MSFDEKLRHAISGENGLWLCENHHKLFDEGFFTFDGKGRIVYRNGLSRNHSQFIERITTNRNIPEEFLTKDFLEYMSKRNEMAG